MSRLTKSQPKRLRSRLAIPENIVILDFGSQYTQVIARRIRECQVFSQILRFDTSAVKLRALKPRGLILSGGPASVYGNAAPHCDPAIWNLGIPVLGICYGMQLMAHQLGGRVEKGDKREYGHAEVEITGDSPLFAMMESRQKVWMSHGDKMTKVPDGFHSVAHSQNSPYAAIANSQRRFSAYSFTLKSITRHMGSRSFRTSCMVSAVAVAIGT
jgi:GMP synthase (glutamine-hydrolysing)